MPVVLLAGFGGGPHLPGARRRGGIVDALYGGSGSGLGGHAFVKPDGHVALQLEVHTGHAFFDLTAFGEDELEPLQLPLQLP